MRGYFGIKLNLALTFMLGFVSFQLKDALEIVIFCKEVLMVALICVVTRSYFKKDKKHIPPNGGDYLG